MDSLPRVALDYYVLRLGRSFQGPDIRAVLVRASPHRTIPASQNLTGLSSLQRSSIAHDAQVRVVRVRSVRVRRAGARRAGASCGRVGTPTHMDWRGEAPPLYRATPQIKTQKYLV